MNFLKRLSVKDPNVFRMESFQAVNRNSMPEGVLSSGSSGEKQPSLSEAAPGWLAQAEQRWTNAFFFREHFPPEKVVAVENTLGKTNEKALYLMTGTKK